MVQGEGNYADGINDIRTSVEPRAGVGGSEVWLVSPLECLAESREKLYTVFVHVCCEALAAP